QTCALPISVGGLVPQRQPAVRGGNQGRVPRRLDERRVAILEHGDRRPVVCELRAYDRTGRLQDQTLRHAPVEPALDADEARILVRVLEQRQTVGPLAGATPARRTDVAIALVPDSSGPS